MKFSILIANYNNGQYLDKCIKSVIGQKYENWEIIIVDDASTDNSLKVIKQFLPDERIKLFLNKKNIGCGATKRRCAQKASGEIFGILDSDDALESDALEEIIEKYHKNSEYGVVYTNYYICDEDLEKIKVCAWVKQIETETNLISPSVSHFLTFRAEAYLKTLGFDKYQQRAVDKDIIYKLEEVTRFLFLNKPLYFYRMHKNSISLGKNAQLASAYEARAKYNAFLRRKALDIYNLTRLEMSLVLFKGSIKFFLSMFFIESFKMFFASIKNFVLGVFIKIKNV